MQFSKRKVALCCEDPMLQDYLRRVLEQCPTLEVICSPPSPPLKGVGFFLAWSGLRAGRPRSQRSAYWERERLARMEAATPCSAA